MSRSVLLVSRTESVTPERLDYLHRHCHHLTFAEAEEMVRLGEGQKILIPTSRRKMQMVIRQTHQFPVRGLSCSIGETHAVALQTRELWPRIMLRQIKLQPEAC